MTTRNNTAVRIETASGIRGTEPTRAAEHRTGRLDTGPSETLSGSSGMAIHRSSPSAAIRLAEIRPSAVFSHRSHERSRLPMTCPDNPIRTGRPLEGAENDDNEIPGRRLARVHAD